jgi:uncharacterized membrane protein YcgQ (UPF0703/DUF1980 family)
MKFENQGSVYLSSLTNTEIKYKNKTFVLKQVDGYTMLVSKTKKVKDFTIHACKYFKGGDLEDLEEVYVAEKDEFTAHGKTVKQAIEDVNFKFLQENLDVQKLVKEIKEKQTVSISEYRLLTGACSLGVNNFLQDNNLAVSELPLADVLKITEGHFGHSRLTELF